MIEVHSKPDFDEVLDPNDSNQFASFGKYLGFELADLNYRIYEIENGLCAAQVDKRKFRSSQGSIVYPQGLLGRLSMFPDYSSESGHLRSLTVFSRRSDKLFDLAVGSLAEINFVNVEKMDEKYKKITMSGDGELYATAFIRLLHLPKRELKKIVKINQSKISA